MPPAGNFAALGVFSASLTGGRRFFVNRFIVFVYIWLAFGREVLDYMRSGNMLSRLAVLFLASRPKFLIVSAAAVLVGSSLAYACCGIFHPHLFILAVLAIMFLHAGANITNDYYDHLSGNDWFNASPTPFSGGRRYIQDGILSARATFLAALFAFSAGSAIGLIIIFLTGSVFILVLGIAGLLGGFFYTAPPLRFGYRGFGESVILLLFGVLPVCGAYYLQNPVFNAAAVAVGLIVGILIFLVILVNEFPDYSADVAVGKRTLVVWFGVSAAVRIYRIALLFSFLAAVLSMIVFNEMFFAGLFYVFLLPLGLAAAKATNEEDLSQPGKYTANKLTILLHLLGSAALTVGFLLYGLLGDFIA